MGIPLLLLLIAILSAGVAAYGTDSSWGSVNHGLQLIYTAKRFEWVLLAVSVVACVILIGLVISGKRRSWWLLGLAPVLTLFVHQLTTNAMESYRVADNPKMLAADQASFLNDDDYVVGVTLEQEAYAFPYRQLFATPVVLQDSYSRRLLLIWSAYANRAVAYTVDHDYHGRDLDIVAMPANALLVYNDRYGQFINGITGATSRGLTPTGFRKPLPTIKTTWKTWKNLHPDTQVMAPTMANMAKLPSAPLLPHYKVPPATQPVDYRIVMIATTQPSAVPADVPPRPVNLHDMVILRDPISNIVHAYQRDVDGSKSGKFIPIADGRRPDVFMADSQSRSGWTTAGVAVDGPDKGKKLDAIALDSDVYYNVMKFWIPDLVLKQLPKEADVVPAPPKPVPEERIRSSSSSRSRSRSRRSR